MRNQSILLTTTLGTLALLAACGSKEPASSAATEPAAQGETPPAAQTAPAPAPAATPARPSAPAPAAASKAATKPADRPATPAPKPVRIVTVPSGTTLAISLTTALSSKTAKVDDPVRAVLTSDVVVDGKTAIATGTTVAGSVIAVVSGSDKIGGTPTLAVSFDRLELPGGQDVPISGEITEKGKSDTARDTVKIVGGTAAGAIIGDKVIKGKKGKVIGGLLGGAVGAVAAQKTGTEVQLIEGTALSLTLDAPVEITK